MTVVRSDNFTRTDSILTINPPSDGGASWILQTAGAVCGIASNQGYFVVATSQATAVLESSVADCDVEVTFNVVGSDGGMCWRASGDNDYWLINPTQCYKRSTAGGFVLIATLSTGFSNGDTAKIVLSGDSHTILRNGSSVASFSDSFNNTATKHGIRSNLDTAARWAAFSVSTAAGGGVIGSYYYRQVAGMGGGM